jgi:DNA-directed RNA polymerase sigma subunit (sigma70/sigma32)
MYWVRASVKRSQNFQSRVITVPQRLHDNHKRLMRTENEVYMATGSKPTYKQLGEIVGMSERQVTRCFNAIELQCLSLDQTMHNRNRASKGGDDREDTLINIIENKFTVHDPTAPENIFLRDDLIEALHRHLTEEEVEVLLLRYGLKDAELSNDRTPGKQLTIAELSHVLGLKPDKVRRMINKSLKQLQGAGLDEWMSYEQDLQ